MNDNVAKKQMLKNAQTILCIIIAVAYLFRFWICIIPAAVGVLVTSVMLWYVKVCERKKHKESEPLLALPKPKTQNDIQNEKFSLIQQQISEAVSVEYSLAKWVWEAPNTRKKIEEGEPVYIRLNRAGGYCRAEVKYQGFTVTQVVFMTAPNNSTDTHTDTPTPDTPKTENYQLVAFEWVEENALELNNRINEAIGRDEQEMLIKAEELPVKESWSDVCSELKSAGIDNAEIVSDGITVKFTQKNAERE